VALHRSLDALAGDGVTHLAIEASSHGLDQHRLDGLHIAAAGFTNITRDHLDYHATFEAYLAAKLRLFEVLLAPGAAAVIDVDRDHADAVMAAATAHGLSVMSVGRNGTGIRLLHCAIDGFAQTLRLEYGASHFQV
jgi:UDP-N-acetylmuramoyl-L-alanyl-D-glutamate--2,6-diaminopimelate ligase